MRKAMTTKRLSFREAWQAMLRGRRIARRCVSRELLGDLRFWARMTGKRIYGTGGSLVLSV